MVCLVLSPEDVIFLTTILSFESNSSAMFALLLSFSISDNLTHVITLLDHGFLDCAFKILSVEYSSSDCRLVMLALVVLIQIQKEISEEY